MTKKSIALTRRTLVAAGAAGALTSLGSPFIRTARAAPVKIRYATGGGIGPNEMETIIYLDWMQKNVLKGYGRDYTVEMTFTRGTPEAGTLLAAGQADMATLSFAVFATSVLKSIVPGGMTIVSDNYQDGRAGFAQNTFFVLKDSPIQIDPGFERQEGRHQCLRRGGRSRAARQAQEGRDRPAPRPHRRRGRVPQPGRRNPREAHRLRHPDPAVHECRAAQGRSAGLVHRRGCLRSLCGDLPDRHQRVPQEEH